MQDGSNEDHLWAMLGQQGEERSPGEAPQVSGLSQSPSFLDRLTQRMASGVLPLFLAGLGSVLPFALIGEWMGIGLGLLLLLVFSGLLAPLVRSRGFLSALRLSLLFIPLTLLSVTAAILPIQIMNHADIRLTALFFQFALEAVLGWYGLGLFAGVLLLVGWPAYLLAKSRPWIRVQSAGVGRKLVAALLLLSPLAAYGSLWQRSVPTREESSWRVAAEKLLPPEMPGGGAAWNELYTTYNLIMLDRENTQVPELRELVGKMKRQMAAGLVNSTVEAASVDYLVGELLKDHRLEFSSETTTELSYLQIHARLLSRPRYQYLQTVEKFRIFILPQLLQQPDISKWESRIQVLEELLPSTQMAELDMNAAAFFYRDKVLGPEVFGKVTGQENRRKVYLNPLRQLQEKKSFKAEPLRIWGREFNGSPSQLAERYSKRSEVQAWLSYRSELIPMEPTKRISWIQALQPQGPHGMSQPFLEELAGRNYTLSFRPWLQSARLILRLQKLRAQGLPPVLSTDEKERWSLETVGDGWLLTDKFLTESGPGKSSSWILQ